MVPGSRARLPLGLATFALAALAAASCTPPLNPAGDPLKAPTTGEAFGGKQCPVVRSPNQPDLMAWDPGSRSDLNRLRQEGVVAVRYHLAGCDAELQLLNCVAPAGKYRFTPYSATESKVARNDMELFAELPVGAARLQGKMKGDRALRIDYMLAGQYALPVGTTLGVGDLKGECSRATHIVSAVHVGAFAMGAGETRAIEGGVSLLVPGVGGGARSSAAVESLSREGSPEACKASQDDRKENAGCAVPLRIHLVPLDGIAAAEPPRIAPPPPGVAPPGAAQPASVTPPPPPPTTSSSREGMVSIPSGTFMMGSDSGEADEKPVHRVSVSAFLMDVTEVTVFAYAACVRAGKCTAAATTEQCNYGKADKLNHPINCIDWDQATAYCGAQGKRLPTEEEWEYAARGSEGRTYSWGEAPPGNQVCWNRWESKAGTCAVASFPRGAFGLADMTGNVWEWISSNYSADYSKSRTSAARVNRGGGWNNTLPSGLRGALRLWYAPSYRDYDLGFRCCAQ